ILARGNLQSTIYNGSSSYLPPQNLAQRRVEWALAQASVVGLSEVHLVGQLAAERSQVGTALHRVAKGRVLEQERGLVMRLQFAGEQLVRRAHRQVDRVAAGQQLAIALSAIRRVGQRLAAVQVAVVAGRVGTDARQQVADARPLAFARD